MIINPILKRHWQTEVTKRSVATVSLLLFLVMFLLYSSIFLDPFRGQMIQTMLGIFSGISTLAGIVCVIKASRSVIEEFDQATWDWIRTSSVSARTILIGKIFGPGALYWLIFITCFCFKQIHTVIFFEPEIVFDTLLINTYLFVLGALAIIFSAALAICSPLLSKQNRRRVGRGSAGVLLALIIIPTFASFPGNNQSIFWYSINYHSDSFILFWLLIFTIVAIYTAYSSLRRELQSKLMPIGLPIFAVLFSFFVTGFISAATPIIEKSSYFDLVILINTHILFLITYVTILGMSTNWIPLKIFISKALKKDYFGALMLLPSWVGMLIVVTIFWLVSLIFSSNPIRPMLLACIIILIRDLSAILLINFHPKFKFKQPMIAVFIVLALEYALIPAFLVLFEIKRVILLIIPIYGLPTKPVNIFSMSLVMISAVFSAMLFSYAIKILLDRIKAS